MNEEKLTKKFIGEMKKVFPTKEYLEKNFITRKEWIFDRRENSEFRKEMREFRAETRATFEEINERLDELKHSANALDEILEQHPIERIANLERHTKAPALEFVGKE